MHKRPKSSLVRKLRRMLGVDEILKNQRALIDSDNFLNSVASVIHVGANIGQERELYDRFGVRVLWIEPIPSVFEELQANIATFKRQQAVQALATDVDNQEYQLNVASNNGASSSILELNEHKDIWPGIKYVDSILHYQ